MRRRQWAPGGQNLGSCCWMVLAVYTLALPHPCPRVSYLVCISSLCARHPCLVEYTFSDRWLSGVSCFQQIANLEAEVELITLQLMGNFSLGPLYFTAYHST